MERLHLQQDSSETRKKGGRKGEASSGHDWEGGKKGGGKKGPPVKKVSQKEKGAATKRGRQGQGEGGSK